ncbi:hypothetical protein Osc1_20650 [Hominimerdicola sp. 21CYCFAH17_S]
MRNTKRILAGIIAAASVFGIVGCGKSQKSEEESYVDKVKVEDTDQIAAISDGAEKDLIWLSYFDINPTKREPETRTDLDLFQKKGGSITYWQTPSMEKYEQLAAKLMSNDPPDMFWYEQKMTFPANVIKDMFQPIDELVDFDSSLWSGVKDTAENFALNGKHYVAPVKFVTNSVLTYDKSMIEASQLEDPYDLYMAGDWDWDTWYDLMDEYCSGASDGEERFGVNGWFAPFIFHSTGKTLISYDSENKEYVSNIYDADFERASELLYNIQKNGMYYSDWVGQAADAFKKNILFYAMGPWAVSGTHKPADGERWGIVPMPKDPNSDTYYCTPEINAYMWVKGSTKKEAMKTWMECARLVNTDEKYKQIDKEKFFTTNSNWTEEMYNMAYEETFTDKYVQMIDPGYGISTELSDDDAATTATKEAIISYMYSSVMKTDDDGAQYTWTQLRETYNNTIDSELKTFNAQYKKFIGK